MTARRKHIRSKVLAAQGHVCRACGKPCPLDAEADHIIPLALGGADEPEACQTLCRACHKAKTKGDVRAIARAKRVGKRETEFQRRMAEKAGG